MKILNVSYSDLFGGAAKSSYRIHNAINSISGEYVSKMIVIKKESKDKNVLTFENIITKFVFRLKNYLMVILSKLEKNQNPTSYNFFNSPILNKINNSDFDIVNLHWINAETISITDITNIKKPFIITMHDMWWICGTENYLSLNDKSWKKGKFNNFFSDYNYKKKFGIKPLAIVCPSKWLSKISTKSSLYNKSKIINIPYPVNQKIFCPRKITKIKKFNLVKNKKIKIFFGVFGNTDDYRKGLDLLIKSLNKIDKKLFELIIASKNKLNNKVKFSVTNLSYIDNEKDLSKIYNICDIVVICSRLDNLPNIALEAQSCGKPLVGYDVGGISDIIINNENGYLIKPFNINEFSKKLQILIKSKNRRINFSKNAYQFAKKKWSEKQVRIRYKNFLSNLI